MAKRACQKFAILYYFLKNEKFPDHKEITLNNCTKEGWAFFLKRDERSGITATVITDLNEARTLFEKA